MNLQANSQILSPQNSKDTKVKMVYDEEECLLMDSKEGRVKASRDRASFGGDLKHTNQSQVKVSSSAISGGKISPQLMRKSNQLKLSSADLIRRSDDVKTEDNVLLLTSDKMHAIQTHGLIQNSGGVQLSPSDPKAMVSFQQAQGIIHIGVHASPKSRGESAVGNASNHFVDPSFGLSSSLKNFMVATGGVTRLNSGRRNITLKTMQFEVIDN